MSLRSVLLILVTLAALTLCADLAVEAHRIQVAATQACGDVKPTITKLDASVQQVSASVSNLTDQVNGATATLEADTRRVADGVDTVIQRVDAAVDRTGASVSKAVTEAVNPLPTLATPPSLVSFLHPTATLSSTPAPKKP